MRRFVGIVARHGGCEQPGAAYRRVDRRTLGEETSRPWQIFASKAMPLTTLHDQGPGVPQYSVEVAKSVLCFLDEFVEWFVYESEHS